MDILSDKKSERVLRTLEQPTINPTDEQYTISVAFCGHNGAVAIAKGKEILEVIETERFLNNKNFDFTFRLWKEPQSKELVTMEKNIVETYLKLIADYVHSKYARSFDYGIYVERKHFVFPDSNKFIDFKMEADEKYQVEFLKLFNVKEWRYCSHHSAHSAGVFYQSRFDKALVLSVDGGSMDGPTNFFVYDRKQGMIDYIGSGKYSLGKVYTRFANLFADIKFTSFNNSLVSPGKLMGLAGYGNPIQQDIPLVIEIMKNDLSTYKSLILEYFKKHDIPEHFYDQIMHLHYTVREACGPPKEEERLKGQKAYDIAATVQAAYEKFYIDCCLPVVFNHPNLPVCVTGGCAMNINMNTILVEQYGLNVFAGPNPSDTGLAQGALLFYLKPEKPCDNPYLGTYLLDKDMFGTYIMENVGLTEKNYNIFNIEQNIGLLAEFISKGKIIGVARGRAEIGPRALGNRSIICSATISDMKDIVNAKVKHREWFRPFAPVVRLQDVSKYFHWDKQTRYMSFCPRVREEYLEKLKPIVHVDGTARVQTVTREQNEFLYDLLTEIEEVDKYGVLLNTSFNVDGKPIISTIKDAFEVLNNTRLDGIVIDNTLILKKEQ